MLQNSFVHLPGIGAETEQKLWAQGLKTWDDLSLNLSDLFGPQKAKKLALAIDESQAAHESGEIQYFQPKFKGAEMWRLLPSFIQKNSAIAYLDIETTGLGFPPQCQSTTISVLFKGQLHIEHDRLRKLQLLESVQAEAELLVTFNGGTFDLPFLRREFGLQLRQTHLDLRYWMARLDHKGGLKKVQKAFQEIHQRQSMDIDGFDAVRLWNLHLRGVPKALETLMTYNAEDTVVLEQLIFCGLNLEALNRPGLQLATYKIPLVPKIPTQVCPFVYRALRN